MIAATSLLKDFRMIFFILRLKLCTKIENCNKHKKTYFLPEIHRKLLEKSILFIIEKDLENF